MFLQGLWPLKLDWDDVIDEEKLHEWSKFESEAKSLDELRFSRCYRGRKEAADDFQLHVFADSSMKAKCAVAYYRFCYENGEGGVSLVSSRVRVTPLKRVTIPRLELDAVRMGINLAATIVEESSVKVQRIVLWTDSLICRHWLTQPSRRYKDYVAHRIVDFQEKVESLEQNGVNVNIRYVPTEINVADIGTRGASPPYLDHDSSWQLGPAFLRNPENEWPCGPTEQVCDDPSELRKFAHSGTVCVFSESNLIDLEDYSTLWKAKRVVACVLRCVQKFKATLTKASVLVNRSPSVEELQQAENVLIRIAQRESFGREVDCLVRGEPIPKNSKLVKITPVIDDKGLLRAKGRLENAPIDFDAKHPIVVDSKSRFGQLLIAHYHTQLAHGPVDHVCNEIRQRYWIVGGKSAVKKFSQSCLVCKRKKSRPSPPLMSALPERRVTPYCPPFFHTFVDLFGPIKVKERRSQVKRWGVIFTCSTVRAVYLDVVETLETDSFLSCFFRFGTKRGYPRTLTSDQGTNFIGAAREMREAVNNFDHEKIRDSMLESNTEWIFNQPTASHMNGVVERLIRSVKQALAVVLHGQVLTQGVLTTSLAIVEATLNSRPLTTPSDDPQDLTAITPNSFLIQRSSSSPPIANVQEREINSRKKYRQALALANMFWDRWRREYLPSLIVRPKWTSESRNLEEGDVVLIMEPNVARDHWPLARVVKVLPSSDGRVRKVEVKTQSGILTRPVTKLCLLEERAMTRK